MLGKGEVSSWVRGEGEEGVQEGRDEEALGVGRRLLGGFPWDDRGNPRLLFSPLLLFFQSLVLVGFSFTCNISRDVI